MKYGRRYGGTGNIHIIVNDDVERPGLFLEEFFSDFFTDEDFIQQKTKVVALVQ
jgi:hypothetical protein